MARASRRTGAEADGVPGVRLYVASTGWPYKPCHAPQRPLVVLHGAAHDGLEQYASGSGHVCRRYAELVCAVAEPEHDNVFVVDLAGVAPPSEWRQELVRPGRARRMLENWFAKFNPMGATVIACGEGAALVGPLLQLGGERRVARVVAACAALPQRTQDALAGAEVLVLPEASPQRVAEALAPAGRAAGEEGRARPADLHFVAVELGLDPRTKQLVQKAQNITASVMCQVGPASLPAEFECGAADAAGGPAAATAAAPGCYAASPAIAPSAAPRERAPGGRAVAGPATHHLSAGMAFSGLVVQVLASTTDATHNRVVLADNRGSVDALFPRSVSLLRGKFVSVAGHVVSLEGRLYVMGEHAEPAVGLRDGYDPVVLGVRSASSHARSFGCMVLRGDKCVLARRQGVLHLPTVAARACETAEQAATRAVAEACDIYQEEVALLRDVAPAVVYDRSGEEPRVVTIFAALATSPPPAGYDEEESEDEEDLYDWFVYEKMLRRLPSEHERCAVEQLAAGVARAIDAGIVVPEFHCTFGPHSLRAPRGAEGLAVAIEPLPVTLLSGFFGAGKTALLRYILKNSRGLRVAVVVNELAGVAADIQSLGGDDAGRQGGGPAHVVELTGGSACCAAWEDFRSCITELQRQQCFDCVVVECCAACRPSRMVARFSQDGGPSGAGLGGVARLEAAVTVVDGARVRDQLADAQVEQLLEDQIEFASVLVLNKCDLLDQSDIAELREMLQCMSPRAAVLEATHSEVALNCILPAQGVAQEVRRHQPKQAGKDGRGAANADTFGLRAFSWRRRRPLHPGRFTELLQKQDGVHPSVLRVKGFVWIASRHDIAGVLSCVGCSYELNQGHTWWAATEEGTWPDGLWQDLKQLWHEPHGDRMQEVVVVINADEQADVENRLDACLLTDEEMQRESWDFPDTLPAWDAPIEGPFSLQALEQCMPCTPAGGARHIARWEVARG